MILFWKSIWNVQGVLREFLRSFEGVLEKFQGVLE